MCAPSITIAWHDTIIQHVQRNTRMKFLIQQVSIAGFSLGAQIAGFIGAAFSQHKLVAIYGMISNQRFSLTQI